MLALIASATDRELAKYVEYLKHENKILRARLPKQVHSTHDERQTLLKYGKGWGRAIEELIHHRFSRTARYDGLPRLLKTQATCEQLVQRLNQASYDNILQDGF